MMLTANSGDRVSLLAGVFLAGYATCAVVDRVPLLKRQVPALQAQVHQEKAKTKVAEKKAASEHCEHEITLSIVAADNGRTYHPPVCPPEIRAKVQRDLETKAGE